MKDVRRANYLKTQLCRRGLVDWAVVNDSSAFCTTIPSIFDKGHSRVLGLQGSRSPSFLFGRLCLGDPSLLVYDLQSITAVRLSNFGRGSPLERDGIQHVII